MDHEKKYGVAIIFIITLVSVGAVMVMLANAKSSQPKQYFSPYFLTGGAIKQYCKDNDGGVTPYTRGITVSLRNIGVDRCTSIGVIEYSCDQIGRIVADNILCPYGCYGGACVRSAVANYNFNPFLKSRIRKVIDA